MYNDDDFNEEEIDNGSQPQSQNKILEFYQANKKLVWLLGGIIIFILVFTVLLGGNDNNKPVVSNELKVVISKQSEKLSVGNATQISALVQDANNKNVPNAVIMWSSSDTSIATVDNKDTTGKSVVWSRWGQSTWPAGRGTMAHSSC